MKTEEGVMVMKNGKAWACVYKDGHSTEYGWTNLEDGEIHDPRYCHKPTDVTYKHSSYIETLSTARLAKVRRTTTVEVIP